MHVMDKALVLVQRQEFILEVLSSVYAVDNKKFLSFNTVPIRLN